MPAIIARQCGQHLVGSNPGTFALGSIHLDGPLRIAYIERGVCHRNFRTLVQCRQILLGGLEEGVHIPSLLVLHIQVQRITHTIARNHTRSNGKDCSILNIRRASVYLVDDCLHLVFLCRTLVPRFQLHDNHTERISLPGQQTITGNFLQVQFLRKVFLTLLHAVYNVICRLERATRSGANVDKQRSLVLVGHQSGLGGIHQEYQQHHRKCQQRPSQPAALDEQQHYLLILLDHRLESRVECLAEARSKIILLRSVLIDIRLQQQGTKCGTECQRINRRNTNGHRHRQPKLGIERTGSPSHERYRNKHRHKHQ